MENITMTKTTQSHRVRFASPQAAGRWTSTASTANLATSFHAPMHKALAVKDVAYLRSWRPPV